METIYSKSVPGRRTTGLAPAPAKAGASSFLPEGLLREGLPGLPECSELDVVRHFTQLASKNFSVDGNFYPLGSCTMKYDPKINEVAAGLTGFTSLHPMLAQLANGQGCQGAMHVLYTLKGAFVPSQAWRPSHCSPWLAQTASSPALPS